MRTVLILATIVAATAAFADDFVVIRTSVAETQGLSSVPLLASTDAAGLVAAMGIDELPTGAVYAEELPGGAAVPMQLDLIGDRAQFAGLLPPAPAGQREVRVWLRNAPGEPAMPAEEITMRREGEVVVVQGPTYAVRHDPDINAGILSQISFGDTGKVFAPTFNDRVWNRDMGGFYVRKDAGATMQVVAAGPCMVEVQVAARYLADGGAAPETEPRAIYSLRYWAGLPALQVEARVAQDRPFSWEQLHFLELHYQDDSFLSYAQDDPAQVKEFNDDQSGDRSTRWGALIDGPNVLGMTGSTLIYDGISDYGRYLHGPWVTWDTESTVLQRWLLVSAAPDALAILDRLAAGTVGGQNAVVLSQGVLAALDRLRATAADWSPRSDDRGMLAGALRWRVGLLEAGVRQGRPLDGVLAAARELQALADAGPLRAAAWAPPRAEGRLVLADDRQLGVGLLLTDTGIELASLYDMIRGCEMLGGPTELFTLALTGPEGASASLGTRAGWGRWEAGSSRSGGFATITASFEAPAAEGLAAIRAEVTCEISDGESHWRLAVTNDSAWSIDLVTMPAITVAPLGDSALDDSLYLPQGYGREYPGGIGSRFHGYYPSGSCALPLLIVSDATGGLYLAAHDPGASTRDMVSDAASNAGIPLRIETPAPDAAVAGNDFATAGEIVIARVDGGWYPATQEYRAWLQANAPWWPEGNPDYGRPDRPAWLDEIGAWVLTGGGPESVVEPTAKFAQFMGLPTAIHWYNWHQIPFDNDYPHYFPTKEGFAEGVAALQAQGVRIVPYINGRLWDTDTESFQQEAHRYCTRDRSGEPYIEVYGSGEELAPMCIATQFWRDTLHGIVMRLMTEVGVDGVYMDQIAAARPRLCYDTNHGHPLAGGDWWTAGYWELLERIQTDIAQVSPDKMLTTESNAESYARWFDTYLMCNSLGDGLVPLFPAVYGSKILGFGRYMDRADWDDPEALAQKQGQLFVWGTQLWWSAPTVVDHEFAGPWLRDLARVRYRVREFFNEGRMLAPLVLEGNDTLVHADWHRSGLSATTPAVLATVWGLADGRLLVPLVNCSQDAQTVTLAFDPSDYGLAAATTFTAQRLGPEATADLGVWQGWRRHEIELAGLEAAALVFTPAR